MEMLENLLINHPALVELLWGFAGIALGLMVVIAFLYFYYEYC